MRHATRERAHLGQREVGRREPRHDAPARRRAAVGARGAAADDALLREERRVAARLRDERRGRGAQQLVRVRLSERNRSANKCATGAPRGVNASAR